MADFVAEITLPLGPLPAELLPQSAIVGVIIEIQCETHSQIIHKLHGADHGGAQAKTKNAAKISWNSIKYYTLLFEYIYISADDYLSSRCC